MPAVSIEIDEEIFLPCYRHLLDPYQNFDIEFLYGGRDSGKSRHIAMQLILECLQSKYFKCLLIRKVLNTVRDSQFNLIKSIIEEWGIRSLFLINESRMEIICRNGNGFYGRGLDNVSRIKSFNNPSTAWFEEGNQISNDDFTVVVTSLRAECDIKIWFSFNPECEVNYTDFWLYVEWFSHTTALSFTWEKQVMTEKGPVTFTVRATHTTYKDNPYCTPQRRATYESYKYSKNNAYWYQTFTLGLWGFRKTGDSFWKCFDETKHCREISFDSGLPIFISADNNVNPYIAIGFWQADSTAKELRQVHELACEDPDNTAVKAARAALSYLKSINYNTVLYVGGDPSAKKRSTEDDEGRSFFDKFIAELSTRYQVVNRVQKSAPEVALSGSFINEIYESNYGGWKIIINTTCRKSIEDYTMTKEDMTGNVLKKTETNKDTKVSFQRYGHFTDTKRYIITTVLSTEFTTYKQRNSHIYGYST